MRIGSVVLFSDLKCVQSYGWEYKRSLGALQNVIDSLEEYQCDEVSIIRPVRDLDTMDDFVRDLTIIKSLKCMTPISFGGGIRKAEHLHLIHELPIERLIFSSAFINKDMVLLNRAKDLFGHQALQCMLPLAIRKGEVFVYDSSISGYIPFKDIDSEFIELWANEIIVYDTVNEGGSNVFNWNLINEMPFSRQKIIISGGVGKQTVSNAEQLKIASVLIDNKVLHNEYSISGYKNVTALS